MFGVCVLPEECMTSWHLLLGSTVHAPVTEVAGIVPFFHVKVDLES